MRTLALLLCLAAPAFSDPPGMDAETRDKIVAYMLKTPLADADPTLVSGFMKIDAQTLAPKLRDRARAKQLEVEQVMKVHKGKKKGPFRFPAACEIKRYEGPDGIRIMGMIQGNQEIEGEEEEYIETKTNCTEDQLLCEFSLNIVLMKRKDKPPLKRYFLMETDPLMALVAEKRGGGASAGNRYFQELKPSCQKPAGQ